MIIDLLNRYLKIFVLLVLFWAMLWSYNNVGCGTVEGEEMAPTFDQNSMHILLPGKRLAPEVSEEDVVFFRQNPGKGEQKEFAGKVYAGPGEVVWVERKIVSEQVRVDKSMEVRKEKPRHWSDWNGSERIERSPAAIERPRPPACCCLPRP